MSLSWKWRMRGCRTAQLPKLKKWGSSACYNIYLILHAPTYCLTCLHILFQEPSLHHHRRINLKPSTMDSYVDIRGHLFRANHCNT